VAYSTIFSGTLTDLLAQQDTIAAQFANGDQGYVTIDLTQLLAQVGLTAVWQDMLDFLNNLLAEAGVPGITPALSTGGVIGIGFTINSPQWLVVLTAIAKFFQTYPWFVAFLTAIGYLGITNLVGGTVQKQVGSVVGKGIFCTIGGFLGADCQTGQIVTLAVGALMLIKALK